MFYRSISFKVLSIVLSLALVACESTSTKKSPAAASAPSAVKTAPPAVATASQAQVRQSQREKDIQQLLSDAESALVADQLTTPIHDNAYDRFQAVLLLDKNNEQAKTGLLEVFSRYAEMSRDAIRRGDLGKARALIERAREVDSRSAELAVLETQMAERQKQLRATRKSEPPTPANDKEIILNPTALSQRTDDVVNQLVAIAEAVRESDESLLIFARNDEEGRWMYKKMAEAVLGYRVRGDIRLGKVAKILLLPPIEQAIE